MAIPDCPDCDFSNGEPPLTADKIESMAHWFNTKSRMSDPMHLYASDHETVIGETVESWTTKEVSKVINIDGKSVLLPIGTWMATVKVTDDATWQQIENGTLRGFSAMYVSREHAENVVASKRTLIDDLEDPVPLTISIVDRPCVYDAIFTSVKAGRKISNANLNKIMKAIEGIKGVYDEVKAIVTIAETERLPKESSKEDIDMDKDELKSIIKEAIKEETNPLWEQLESIKTVETESTEPKKEEEGVEDKVEPEPAEKLEDNEAFKALKTELESLKEKLGEKEGNSIKGQDTLPEDKPAVKYGEFEDRDLFGRKKQ